MQGDEEPTKLAAVRYRGELALQHPRVVRVQVWKLEEEERTKKRTKMNECETVWGRWRDHSTSEDHTHTYGVKSRF